MGNESIDYLVNAGKKLTYRFGNHFHPYVGYLVERLNQGELKDLLAVETQGETEAFFEQDYTLNPLQDETLKIGYQDKAIDLSVSGPYSIYNWELFFHIPLAVAVQLSNNQRFAEAQKWFHFIFDPTTDEPEPADYPEGRYWKFRRFREGKTPELIAQLLRELSASAGEEDVDPVIEDLRHSLAEWQKTPFAPHSVAKFRPTAYQLHVVMKYLDNLIAWGDSLFRQFTIETLNEATQIYVLAANVLGRRPQETPRLKKRPIRTYKQVKDRLDEFGNAWVEMENELPLNSNLPGSLGSGVASSRSSSLYGMGPGLYFCIPKNDQLMGYWDTVADRLFKIRHCMDIEGNVRQLPLFQPPIDPGMLVKAAAAGLDLSSVVAGLGQPVSNVRFPVILQRAVDVCGELRALGNALLSVLEKGDAERLAAIRQEHELNILELTRDVKYLQWKDAEAATEALLASRAVAFQRYRHYQLLLGSKEADVAGLEGLSLERPELTEENFDEVYDQLVDQVAAELDPEEYREEKLGLLGEVAGELSSITGFVDSALGVGGSDHLQLNKTEDLDLNVFMPLATALNLASGAVEAVCGVLGLIPQVEAAAKPMGAGAGVDFGGDQLSKVPKFAAQLLQLGGEIISYQAARASKLGSYQRRIDDWVLQNNLAGRELTQIGRQIVAALIREQVAKKDYEIHKVQIEQSQAIGDFLNEQKFTREDLYLWMQGEIFKVYYDCYKLAFDTAKKAEATLKHQLKRDEISQRDFIRFNYWDAGRKGLLSGDALNLDLKRMELAYLESNRREFELMKHVSLRQLDPLALLRLKVMGSCQIEVPEWLFDLDCPGHYMRRIKSAGVSIPSVVGPYSSINCTLSLQKSSIRASPLLTDGRYERDEQNGDARFEDLYGAIQSIVTSHAQNDSGLFEVNLHGERFLPFEGAGAISTWTLDLPSDLRQFDYDTISDVIMHLRYTARQGGGALKAGAVDALKTRIGDQTESMLTRLFSMKHDFPDEWYELTDSEEGDLSIKLADKHFPYMVAALDRTPSAQETRLYKVDEKGKLVGVPSPFKSLASDEVTIARGVVHGLEDAYLVLRYSAAVI